MTDPEAVLPKELKFNALAVTVNSGGNNGGDPAFQSHSIFLFGPDGARLMLSFSAGNPEVAVQNRAFPQYDIDCPLSEYAPTLAQLQAILPRNVAVVIVEAANGVTSWNFSGPIA